MPYQDEDLTDFYTVVVTGNVAGYPQKVTFINCTKVTREANKLKLVVKNGATNYLTPKDHELVQVQKQEGYIQPEEKK
ncbi:MAG: hypothetical protein GOVbin2917_3 [Prokaryotic dsDNA virus sp.]|jgi:hypothetical protein|nr:MAG: hypothetical protein GOVbin2917_3 [Prokaryotic dsDNA virus sp.]|tara:strand:- start:7723 stop:7956 length:234 start_codon:yes stop_codon:yes gene_type:complete